MECPGLPKIIVLSINIIENYYFEKVTDTTK
jgi:hypothetical protein